MTDPVRMKEPPEETAGFVTLGVAFLCGAVVGAIAALLTAPQSGTETRHNIKGWASERKEKLGEMAGKAEAVIDRAVEKGRGTVEKGREFIREKRQAPSDDLGGGLGERRVPRGPRHPE